MDSSYDFEWEDYNIVLVPISLILMTKPMIRAAKQVNGASFVHLNLKMQPGEAGFILNRTKSILEAMRHGVALPPVILKPYHHHYEVLDGRHRVAMSLANHYTHVPAIIVQ